MIVRTLVVWEFTDQAAALINVSKQVHDHLP